MSNYCRSCGVSIPEGQKFCSMCYGDPGYGRDGLYQKWLEDQAWKDEQQRIQEQQAAEQDGVE